MKVKQKGANAERELIHLFWSTGTWSGVRVAGSGSMSYPSPDVIVSNGERRLAIECKSLSGTNKFFATREISELQEFCSKFGAEPWIAMRFDNDKWYFLNLEDMKKNNKGYSISYSIAKQKGLLFEELIGVYRQARLV